MVNAFAVPSRASVNTFITPADLPAIRRGFQSGGDVYTDGSCYYPAHKHRYASAAVVSAIDNHALLAADVVPGTVQTINRAETWAAILITHATPVGGE
eukprot:10890263-Heterocapsa_arctica.AAC.1